MPQKSFARLAVQYLDQPCPPRPVGDLPCLLSQSYDYVDDNGAVTRRGSFDSQQRSTSDTVTQVSVDTTDALNPGSRERYFSQSDTGGQSIQQIEGTFSEGDGERRSVANVEQTQSAHAGSEFEYSAEHRDPVDAGNRSLYSSFANSNSHTKVDSSGTITTDNGKRTVDTGKNRQDNWANTRYGGQTLDEQRSLVEPEQGEVGPTIKSYSFSFSEGETRGNSRGSAEGAGSGGQGAGSVLRYSTTGETADPVTLSSELSPLSSTDVRVTQRGRTNSEGNSRSETVTTDGDDKTVEKVKGDGHSFGKSKSRSDGTVNTGGGSTDSVFDVTTRGEGNSRNTTDVEVRVTTPQYTERFGGTFTVETDGEQTFDGTVETGGATAGSSSSAHVSGDITDDNDVDDITDTEYRRDNLHDNGRPVQLTCQSRICR